ncbi:HDOD domain-containing protein [Allochromatium vinosum]|uniref:Signal transduction protein n=1 Tax=Allochromatium vinosum (strain ATCC 17899 / DSM 180 / NBRC 103801 / NCIMB 10441 / D) TaxID=572477 RepID=D3RTH1_ALLVD|nr:HDOD domain-containing protein [Allochromatium vinosum]ADC62480.1 putative signal transduction protein [Allochromatium vinosum DSM 180]
MVNSAASNHSDHYPPRSDLEAAFQVVRRAKVPQVPDIVLSLRDELHRPDPDLIQAADLVARDLAMTGQVLKTINSPLFASRAKISSIRQAVTLIGLRRLTNLVTAEAFSRLLGEREGGARLILDFIQEQASIASAVASLASELTPDEAYLFGLMQGVGCLIFADLIADYGNEWTLQALTAPQALMDYERRALGTDHVTVGFLLAGTWRLPESVALAIYHQHDFEPPRGFGVHLRALIAVARLARVLLALRRGIEDNPVLLDQRDWGLNELAVTPETWGSFVVRLLTDDPCI